MGGPERNIPKHRARPHRADIEKTFKSALKSVLARYREIKISVIGRKSGKRISLPVWFVFEARNRKAERSTCCRYRARTRSGTRTCSITRRFALMRGAPKPNSEPLP